MVASDTAHPDLPRPRTGLRAAGASAGRLASALAVAVIAGVVALLSGGSSSAPTPPQVAALGAAGPAARSTGSGDGLQVSTAAGPLPLSSRGWRAIGERRDALRGRQVLTVFYRRASAPALALSIVSGAPLPAHGGSLFASAGGSPRRLGRSGRRLLVSWERDGHTCVISGAGLPARELLELGGAA